VFVIGLWPLFTVALVVIALVREVPASAEVES
jgi:hypothetical protein